MPETDHNDDEAPVILLVSCDACGVEFKWRVGFEEGDTRCPDCRGGPQADETPP